MTTGDVIRIFSSTSVANLYVMLKISRCRISSEPQQQKPVLSNDENARILEMQTPDEKHYNSDAIALLLGGTFCSVASDARDKAKQVSKDFSTLKRAFSVSSIEIAGEMPYRDFFEKRDCVLAIEKFLDSIASVFLLYWSGHGDSETGDWRFSDERRLSFKEVLRIWKVLSLCCPIFLKRN